MPNAATAGSAGRIKPNFFVPSSTPYATGTKSGAGVAGTALIVNSTAGKFTVSAELTKRLNVQNGDSILFFDNVVVLNKAVDNKDEAFLEFATDEGLDADSAEARASFVEANKCYFIAKGYPKYDVKGEPVYTKATVTTEMKQAYLDQNRDKIYDEHKEEILKAVKEAYAAQGAELPEDEAELDAVAKEAITVASIDSKDVPAPDVQDYVGSKLASIGGGDGVGTQLNFSDTGIWNGIKADLENPKSVNRRFEILDEHITSTEIVNGSRKEKVVVFPLVFVSDEAPAVVNMAKKESK